MKTLKTICLAFCFLGSLTTIHAQQVVVSAGDSDPDASAMLEVKSSDKGFLPPRMTAVQRDAIAAPAEGLLVFCTNCGYNTTGALSVFINQKWWLLSLCLPLQAPVEGTHVASLTQIVWNWNAVAGASGYKWNTSDNYSTATDMGASLTKTETGLTENTTYTRYVWAWSACWVPTFATMTKTTSFPCGTTSITVNHLATGGVAPVDKTVTYGTVTNIPGETSKCWITSNLGADHQATAKDDATEASAGWYWQFNRKQGYKHDGITRTPNTPWISIISENTDWIQANDPCALELGPGWHVPTHTEWYSVDNTGGWTNWNGPWNSALQLHAAGLLNNNADGWLQARGGLGYYWSSSRQNADFGLGLDFSIGNSDIHGLDKANGFTLRCIHE